MAGGHAGRGPRLPHAGRSPDVRREGAERDDHRRAVVRRRWPPAQHRAGAGRRRRGRVVAGRAVRRAGDLDRQPRPAAAVRGPHDRHHLDATGPGRQPLGEPGRCARPLQLRYYTLRPSWRTRGGGDGAVAVAGYVELRDPDRRVPWTLVNQGTADRALTGADFDPESFRRAPDGTFWFGEEFGPFLLHADATGRLFEPPYPLPVPAALGPQRGLSEVRSPDHPAFVGLPSADARNGASNLPGSRGFEEMVLIRLARPLRGGGAAVAPTQLPRTGAPAALALWLGAVLVGLGARL